METTFFDKSIHHQVLIRDTKFFSQRGEDRWIFENVPFGLPSRGVFLDLGCNHPINNNNTYAFEKYLGWNGVGVDINFVHSTGWVKERPRSIFYAGAVITNDYPIPAIEVRPDDRNNWELLRNEISHGGGTVMVAGIRVENLLHFADKIDLLSIDVEGMETELLEDIFKTHKPSIIIAEYITLGLPENKTLLPLCESHGYKLVHTTDFNYIFTL